MEGITGTITFNALVWPWLPQTGRFADNFEEEIIKDQHGADCAWLARNRHLMLDLGMKIVGMSAATKASLYANWPLPPYTKITLSGFVFATDDLGGGGLNGTYQYLTGADLNLSFDKVSEAAFKLRKYVDPTQAALSVTTPS